MPSATSHRRLLAIEAQRAERSQDALRVPRATAGQDAADRRRLRPSSARHRGLPSQSPAGAESSGCRTPRDHQVGVVTSRPGRGGGPRGSPGPAFKQELPRWVRRAVQGNPCSHPRQFPSGWKHGVLPSTIQRVAPRGRSVDTC